MTEEQEKIFSESVKRYKELVIELEKDLGYELTQDQKRDMIRDDDFIEELDLSDMEKDYYIEELNKAYSGFPRVIDIYAPVTTNDLYILPGKEPSKMIMYNKKHKK